MTRWHRERPLKRTREDDTDFTDLKTDNYQCLHEDEFILCDTEAGSFTVIVPDVIEAKDREQLIKIVGEGNNPLFIVTQGLTLFRVDAEDQPYQLRGKGAAVLIVSDGTQFYIKAEFRPDGRDARFTEIQFDDFVMTFDDEIVLCDPSAGQFTVTLPAAEDSGNHEYTIKIVGGSQNRIIILTPGAELIDGDLTFEIRKPDSSVVIISDGEDFFVKSNLKG